MTMLSQREKTESSQQQKSSRTLTTVLEVLGVDAGGADDRLATSEDLIAEITEDRVGERFFVVIAPLVELLQLLQHFSLAAGQ